ncbi:unnamed protein product [Symbiodinium necroappetens]|uniref:Uncharacterized protein n=1 Tax=Symbiodinium necroappetens TaxID=1628268 RepID=A0A812M4R5_9DINO|nr:unnamed protein product [Symbiodinium necroappetens]
MDYGAMCRFCREECKVEVHPESIHTARLKQSDCFRRFQAFFSGQHDFFFVAVQGESADGKLQLHDGTVSCEDVLQLWRNRRRLALPPAILFLLLDFCHSGAWVDVCKRQAPEPEVFVQAACSAGGATPDNYEGSFTQKWIKAQREKKFKLTRIPCLQLWNPCYHAPAGAGLPEFGKCSILLVGSDTAAQQHVALVSHGVSKVDGSSFLKDGSSLFNLHVSTMNLYSSSQFQSCSKFQDAAEAMRTARKTATSVKRVEVALLFHLEDYYIFWRYGDHEQMWQALDMVAKMTRSCTTENAAAIRALALAWKSCKCLGRLQLQHSRSMFEQATEALSEMIAIYDQASLSNVVCAEVTMALGFWNEWRAQQYGQPEPDAWPRAKMLLSRTLEHYGHCGFLEELANDGLKLCGIQLQMDVADKHATPYEVLVTEAQTLIRGHLLTVQRKGLERFSERSSIRCLATLIQACCPRPSEKEKGLGLLVVSQLAPAAMLLHCYMAHGHREDQLVDEFSQARMMTSVGCRIMFFLDASSLPSLEPFMWYAPYLHKSAR